MDLRDPRFLTRQQLQEDIALPKVGVKYTDSSGASKLFSVASANELGSLDAAFGAAAAGVRRERNLDLANRINFYGKKELKAAEGSAVVIEKDEISLKGEREGESRRGKAFFGTDRAGKIGWHSIDVMDAPRKGMNVGRPLNASIVPEAATRDINETGLPWSFEVSRFAYTEAEEGGSVSLYNLYRTIYVSAMGRIIGMSEERQVLLGVVKYGGSNGKYCVQPTFTDGGILSSLRFGTEAQLDAKEPEKIVNTHIGCPYQS